jgi:tetratricopeptide (TPR) repeat protein
MIDTRPDVSTYARVSYAQELQGNLPFAIRNMELAYESAGTPADQAWASYYLGELYWNSGRPDDAMRYYARGSEIDPSFVPNFEGLAKVEAARGDTLSAIRDYTEVVARYPLPQYVIELGDLYTITGQTDRANQEYELVRTEERLFQANGVNIDLDIALFNADHRVDLAAGLAAARAEWARRQSIAVADALAWELHANGRDAEALTYATRSLALGTQSALFFFHKGMIEKSLGRTAAAPADLAKAISINPDFSFLWKQTAMDALAALGGAP